MLKKDSRIQLTDTILDVVIKMSGGNPGAMEAVVRLQKEAAAIDPDDIMGGLGCVLFLDTLSIYDSNIYLLYNDICRRDLPSMVALLRAVQLGYLSSAALTEAIRAETMDAALFAEMMSKVKERLPNFNFTEVTQ